MSCQDFFWLKAVIIPDSKWMILATRHETLSIFRDLERSSSHWMSLEHIGGLISASVESKLCDLFVLSAHQKSIFLTWNTFNGSGDVHNIWKLIFVFELWSRGLSLCERFLHIFWQLIFLVGSDHQGNSLVEENAGLSFRANNTNLSIDWCCDNMLVVGHHVAGHQHILRFYKNWRKILTYLCSRKLGSLVFWDPKS